MIVCDQWWLLYGPCVAEATHTKFGEWVRVYSWMLSDY